MINLNTTSQFSNIVSKESEPAKNSMWILIKKEANPAGTLNSYKLKDLYSFKYFTSINLCKHKAPLFNSECNRCQDLLTTITNINNVAQKVFPAAENEFSARIAMLNPSIDKNMFIGFIENQKPAMQYHFKMQNFSYNNPYDIESEEIEAGNYRLVQGVLNQLGYYSYVKEIDGKSSYFFTFPDYSYLQSKWRELMDSHEISYDLKVFHSTQQISAQEYIEKFFDFDLIVSDDEIVHDQAIHVLPFLQKFIKTFVLKHPLSAKEAPLLFAQNKKQKFSQLYDDFQFIRNLKNRSIHIGFAPSATDIELAFSIMGAVCDAAATQGFKTEDLTYNSFNENWLLYFQTKFCDLQITNDTLVNHISNLKNKYTSC